MMLTFYYILYGIYYEFLWALICMCRPSILCYLGQQQINFRESKLVPIAPGAFTIKK